MRQDQLALHTALTLTTRLSRCETCETLTASLRNGKKIHNLASTRGSRLVWKKTELIAYFAGLFDGEGCINISSRMARGGVSPSFRLTTIITNNVHAPLASAQRIWGGAIHARRGAHVFTYQWRLSGNGAVPFLTDVLPYLMVKQDEAQLAIDFQARITGARFLPLPQAEIDARQAMKDRLHALKGAMYKAVKCSD